jgi:hypothetical protein
MLDAPRDHSNHIGLDEVPERADRRLVARARWRVRLRTGFCDILACRPSFQSRVPRGRHPPACYVLKRLVPTR